MKWNEMSTTQKILTVIGWICGIAYLVLSFPELRSYLSIPKAALYPLFGVFWLCLGIVQKDQKFAKWYYVLATAWFALSLWDIFLYLF